MEGEPRREESLARAHGLEVEEVVRLLASDPERGLSGDEVRGPRSMEAERLPDRVRVTVGRDGRSAELGASPKEVPAFSPWDRLPARPSVK